MAEGEDPFAYNDPDLDHDLDEEEVDTTRPFHPTGASTPYHGGQYEMQTIMHGHIGLPDTSYEEAPLLGAQDQIQRSWDSLTRLISPSKRNGSGNIL